MTIDRATFKEKYYTFQFLNCDIGFECSLQDGDSEIEAILKMRESAIAAHKQAYPHLYNESAGSYSISDIEGMQPMLNSLAKKSDPLPDRIQSFIVTINLCNNIKFLENFRTRVERENNEALTMAFQNKLQSLQNQ